MTVKSLLQWAEYLLIRAHIHYTILWMIFPLGTQAFEYCEGSKEHERSEEFKISESQWCFEGDSEPVWQEQNHSHGGGLYVLFANHGVVPSPSVSANVSGQNRTRDTLAIKWWCFKEYEPLSHVYPMTWQEVESSPLFTVTICLKLCLLW